MNKFFRPFLFLLLSACILSCEKDQLVIQDPVSADKLPLVDYTVVPGDDPFTFNFQNKSSDYERVEWRFGDDTLSTELSHPMSISLRVNIKSSFKLITPRRVFRENLLILTLWPIVF